MGDRHGARRFTISEIATRTQRAVAQMPPTCVGWGPHHPTWWVQRRGALGVCLACWLRGYELVAGERIIQL